MIFFFISLFLLSLCINSQGAAAISSIDLTSAIEGGLLNYAITIYESTNVSSLIQCASLCARRDWCVGVAICTASDLPLVPCNLLSADVTLGYPSGDDVSLCDLHFSEERFQNVLSCAGTQTPQQAVTSCASNTPTPPTSGCETSLGGACHCPAGATNANCTTFIADCKSVYWSQGVYTIQPAASTTAFQVYCNAFNLVIQSRDNCNPDFFHRTWQQYKHGFGNVDSDCFWLGNDKINLITEQDEYTLRVKAGSVYRSKYSGFKLGNETTGYTLTYDEFVTSSGGWGWTGDSSKDGFGDCPENQQLQGMQFYTDDNDNDAQCATIRKSGWWYSSACAFGDLNRFGNAEWPRSSDGILDQHESVTMSLV